MAWKVIVSAKAPGTSGTGALSREVSFADEPQVGDLKILKDEAKKAYHELYTVPTPRVHVDFTIRRA